MKSTVQCLSASALFFCAIVAPGRAATLVNVNFNGMTAGQPLAAVSPAVGVLPVTAPWSVVLPTGSTATVSNGFTATNSPFTSFGSGNVLVLKRTIGSGSSNINFETNAQDKLTSGIVSVKFDLMIDNATSLLNPNNDPVTPTGNLSFTVRDGAYKVISSLTLGSNGALTLNGYSAAGVADSNSVIGTLAKAQSYTIELRLDFASGLSQTYLNGSALGGTQAFATANGVVGLVLSPASNSVGQWAFDNIVIQTIPEPSTNMLFSSMALGGVVVLTLRRREKSAA